MKIKKYEHIVMSIATKNKLKEIGNMGDSYEDVVIELIKFWEKKNDNNNKK